MSIEVYSVGAVCASACAPNDASQEDVEYAVNLAHPTGISSQWKISADEKFAGGEPMPCPCEGNADRQHWLLNC